MFVLWVPRRLRAITKAAPASKKVATGTLLFGTMGGIGRMYLTSQRVVAASASPVIDYKADRKKALVKMAPTPAD